MLGRSLAFGSDHLSEHSEQLHAQLVRRDETIGRVRGTRLEQQPVEGVVLAEERRLLGGGEGSEIGALVAAELHGQHDEGATDRVDVRGHRGADVCDFGRLVSRRAVDGGVEVVDPTHSPEVDELHGIPHLDEVVGLEVAVDEVEVVQVLERGQHLEDERDRLIDGQRIVGAAGSPHPCLEEVLERGAADVLHDDVASTLVRHEVVDLDDDRVLDLGQELLLGDGRCQRVRVAGVQQALEHHPPVGHVAVARRVDPAKTTVGDGSGDDVLPAHHISRTQLRREGERVATAGAEALGPTHLTVAGTPHRRPARRTRPAVLTDDGVREHRACGIDRRRRWDRGQAGPQAGAP